MSAISGTAIDKGHAAAVSSVNTNSKTWANGVPYFLYVGEMLASGAPVAPSTPSGWSLVASEVQGGVYQQGSQLYVRVGDGSTGVIALSFGAVTQTYISWVVCSVANSALDGTSTGGMGTPVGNYSTGSTNPTVTLGAFSDAVHDAAFFFAVDSWAVDFTLKASYASLGLDTFNQAIGGEYIVGQDLTPYFTQASGSWSAIGVEVKAPASGAGVVLRGPTLGRRFGR